MMGAEGRWKAAIGLAMAAIVLSLASLVRVSPAPAQSDPGASKAPSFVDDRRLPDDAETAARRKAEAERQAAEEAARKRAEEQERARQAAEAEARRKAEAERQAAEEAARKRAEEEARARQAAEAEAHRKAEAERQAAEEATRKRAEEEERARQAAEAEARRKAEAERQAAEAEARRKADAERQAAEEAARKRTEEEARARQAAERKAAEEAAARKRAEEEAAARKRAEEAAAQARAEEAARARQAAEAEARRKSAESRRSAPADELARRMAGGPCADVQLAGRPQPAGRIEIRVKSQCLAGRNVVISYAGHDIVRTVPAEGEMSFLLDLFEGHAPLAVKLDNGTRMPIDTKGVDLAGISKVAVLWSAPVNLDLHANEYLARRGAEGHVWAKSPGNIDAALTAAREGNRGRGFISMEDTGAGEGIHVEVYTFLHNDSQRTGAVTLLIDYETRGDVPQGDHCGSGRFAQVEAMVVRLRPGGRIDKEKVKFGAAPCGERLTEEKRFNSDTLSDLVARK